MRAMVLVCLVLFVAAPVWAMGEGERVIQIRGSGHFSPRPDSRTGAGLGLSLAKGLSDLYGIRAGTDLAWLPKSGRPAHYLSNLSLCASMTLDALAWVPYVDLGLVVSDFRKPKDSSQWVGTRMEFGLEYTFSPHTSLTFALRTDWLLLRLAGAPTNRPLNLATLFSASRFF